MGFNMEAVAKLFKKSDAKKAAEKKEREARGKAKAKEIEARKNAKQELNCVARLANTQKDVDRERINKLKKTAAKKGSKK
ncbi:hypothetical protein HID58_013099 [Brassica napus]|uniref:Small EDRK-rich factor-like N-terminal domain-containing protein n=2 Tax=Brassica napus TaxID=3708 RepID=A0ABQ8E2Y1_BRANA|nr:hypothetical protein HID58_013099 [Brassica napus]CDY13489.1 BnaA03g52070D [Brassica napus]